MIDNWILTYAVHSTLLLGCAWGLSKLMPEHWHAGRDAVWKSAVLIPMVSASLATWSPATSGLAGLNLNPGVVTTVGPLAMTLPRQVEPEAVVSVVPIENHAIGTSAEPGAGLGAESSLASGADPVAEQAAGTELGSNAGSSAGPSVGPRTESGAAPRTGSSAAQSACLKSGTVGCSPAVDTVQEASGACGGLALCIEPASCPGLAPCSETDRSASGDVSGSDAIQAGVASASVSIAAEECPPLAAKSESVSRLASGSWGLDAPSWLRGLVLLLFGLGATLGLFRGARSWIRIRQILGSRTPLTSGPLREELDDLQRRIGLEGTIRLTDSSAAPAPLAIGLREICVPAHAVEALSREERQAALAHELAHLVRHDPLWFTGLHVLESIFFFLPLHRLARRQIQGEAEYLCDDWATQRTGSRLDLARCLAKVAEWGAVPAPAHAASMAGVSPLVSRVRRLLEPEQTTPRGGRSLAVSGVVALACAVLFFGPRFTETGEAAVAGRDGSTPLATPPPCAPLPSTVGLAPDSPASFPSAVASVSPRAPRAFPVAVAPLRPTPSPAPSVLALDERDRVLGLFPDRLSELDPDDRWIVMQDLAELDELDPDDTWVLFQDLAELDELDPDDTWIVMQELAELDASSFPEAPLAPHIFEVHPGSGPGGVHWLAPHGDRLALWESELSEEQRRDMEEGRLTVRVEGRDGSLTARIEDGEIHELVLDGEEIPGDRYDFDGETLVVWDEDHEDEIFVTELPIERLRGATLRHRSLRTETLPRLRNQLLELKERTGSSTIELLERQAEAETILEFLGQQSADPAERERSRSAAMRAREERFQLERELFEQSEATRARVEERFSNEDRARELKRMARELRNQKLALEHHLEELERQLRSLEETENGEEAGQRDETEPSNEDSDGSDRYWEGPYEWDDDRIGVPWTDAPASALPGERGSAAVQ